MASERCPVNLDLISCSKSLNERLDEVLRLCLDDGELDRPISPAGQASRDSIALKMLRKTSMMIFLYDRGIYASHALSVQCYILPFHMSRNVSLRLPGIGVPVHSRVRKLGESCSIR